MLAALRKPCRRAAANTSTLAQAAFLLAAALLIWSCLVGPGQARKRVSSIVAEREAAIASAAPMVRLRLGGHLSTVARCMRATAPISTLRFKPRSEAELVAAVTASETRCNVEAIYAATGENESAAWMLIHALHRYGFRLPSELIDALNERIAHDGLPHV